MRGKGYTPWIVAVVMILIAIPTLALTLIPDSKAITVERLGGPFYTCSIVRDRKVCNVAADAYAADSAGHTEDWTGRFGACAPQRVSAVAPIMEDGYTKRVILWCER